jgi:hypothetical protein
VIFDRLKSQDNTIGSVECGTLEQTAGTLLSLMVSMGMANPTSPTNNSNKAVTIKKKGKAYVITIGLFTPPLTFTWTGLFPQGNLVDVLSKVIEDNKKISSLNTITHPSGKKYLQLGLAIN